MPPPSNLILQINMELYGIYSFISCLFSCWVLDVFVLFLFFASQYTVMLLDVTKYCRFWRDSGVRGGGKEKHRDAGRWTEKRGMREKEGRV